MADFRKLFFAFALVALLLGAGTANAQQQPSVQQAFSCTANAGAPVLVRVEGITELIGDLLLQCTGGNPTPRGNPVPSSDIRLSLNTNITSRLLGSSGAGTGNSIDALLLLDEPYPNDSNTPQNTHPGPGDANVAAGIIGNVTVPPNSPFQSLCFSFRNPVPGACNYLLGTFSNPAVSGAYGTPNSPYLQANQTAQSNPSAATVYVARQVSASAVEWDGVSIDPPGTTGVRVIRMTNVRANACQLGLSSTLIPTQIVGFVAVVGGQLFTINNPQQTLAFINQGLIVAGGGNSNQLNSQAIQQCVNENTGGGGNGGNQGSSTSSVQAVTSVNVREGFAQSFKPQIHSPDTSISGLGQVGNSTASGPLANGGVFYNAAFQNVPGYAYNTETGFQPTGSSGAFALDSSNRLGTGLFGTRILLRFSNVGTGVGIILPGVVALTIDNGGTSGNPLPPSALPGPWTGGYMVLVGTSDLQGNTGVFTNALTPTTAPGFNTSTGGSNGGVNFFTSNPFKGPGAIAPFNSPFIIAGAAGSAAAVYEVVNSDPSAVEQGNIPIGVFFTSNTAQNLPAPGQTTVNVSFAPLSTNNTASGSDFIPRFCDQSVARNSFNIVICQCNLLFPFVTQAAGFDTGIAIANTSTDPYGTTPQTGPVSFFFYGQVTGGGALPSALAKQTTTGNVPSGQVLTYTAFGGAGAFAAGLQPVPGFTGYLITIANFQYCHGFAFISDLGAQKLAEGYLAINLDDGSLIRGTTGENRAH